ncbi:MAG: hypothetical protein CMJ38_01645 [Phycisphaerae bacterium]|nr:hypothetical protein [Phycisphaerae bacterium]
MKILHYFPTTRLTEGGTVRAAIDLSTALARIGHDVTWLTTDDCDVPEHWGNEPNTPHIQLLGTMEKFAERLSRKQIDRATAVAASNDVVHIHAMWNPSNVQMATACKKAGTPWVLSTHGMLDDWCMEQRGLKKRIYLATYGKKLVHGATTILTTAEEEKRQATRWLPRDNAIAIPLIVDLEPYANVPNPALAEEAFGSFPNKSVLFLSRVHPKKSIETLIETASILKEQGESPSFLIAGTGEQQYIDSLQKQVDQLGLTDQFKFLGMVVGETKLSLFAHADVFALPTQQENFGLVYPEAMLCETPVITTKGTDIWRELESGGGAVIIDRDATAFADAILSVLSDDAKREEMGKSARRHMLHWLDTGQVVKSYEAMYEKAATVPAV